MKDGKRRQLEMFLTTDVGVVDEVLGGKGWTDKVGLGGYEYGHTDHNRGLGEHFRGDIDAGALRMDMNVVRERRKERERPRVPLEGVETPGVGKKMEVVDGPLLKWNLGQAADVASSVPMPQSAAGENRV